MQWSSIGYRVTLLLAFVAFAFTESNATAQLPPQFREIERFLDENTSVVTLYSPGKWDAVKVNELVGTFASANENGFEVFNRSLSDAGIERMFGIGDLGQVVNGSGVLVIPSKNASKVIEAGRGLFGPGLEFREVDGFVLLSRKGDAIDTLLRKKGAPSKKLTEALSKANGSNITAIASPSSNSIEFLIGMVRGTIKDPDLAALIELTPKIQYAVLSGEMPTPMTMEVKLDSNESAEQLKDLATKCLLKIATSKEGLPQFQVTGDMFKYHVDSTKELVRQLEALGAAKARQNAAEMRSMSNMRQILLAFHNFHDANKRFPPQALTDAAGKKHLSWRVLILPYIDQQALYDQFHLDEPWDSEHNLKLVDKMPEAYLSYPGDPKGKTRYVVPLTANSIFGKPGKPSRLPDITDGTSNTVALVEVSNKAAVTWTQPEDIIIGKDNPLKGIVDADQAAFVVALADGSVRKILSTIDKMNFLNAIGMNDGEVVELDK